MANPSLKKARIRELMTQQRLEEARALCERTLAATPGDVGMWLLGAVIHGMLEQPQQTERYAREALRLRPDFAEAHNSLGLALRLQGRAAEAVPVLQEAARLKPDYADAFYNLGVTFSGMGQLTEAAENFQRALALRPRDPEALNDLGNVLQGLHRYTEAVDCYRRALALNPTFALAHFNLGNALADLGKTSEAIVHYQKAVEIDTTFAEAHYNLGEAYLECGRFDEAITDFGQALRLNPWHAEAMTNLGVALEKTGRIEEAITVDRRALEFHPDNANNHFNLGNALRKRGRWEEAAESYQQSLALSPAHAGAHFNLALVYLARGRLKDGWREYSWQWRREGAPRRPFPPSTWDGSNLAGRNVFLHEEQGLGDELFFLRFVPWLKQQGAGKIIYRPNAKIASLLSRAKVLDRIAARNERPSGADLVFSVGDLPRLLGMERPEQAPAPFELTPQPERIAAIRQRLGECGPPPYVGVTWRAGTTKKNAVHKESPFAGIARALKDVPGTVLVLQRKPQPGEIGAFTQALGRPVHDFSALNDDLEGMLALLELIDEYIGVSNTNMLLRAGVGRTARVLVPAPPEWRWMAEGKESPWFPGFTVYRQGYDGSWEEAFAQLERELQTSPI